MKVLAYQSGKDFMNRNRLFQKLSFRLQSNDILCCSRLAFSRWRLALVLDQEPDAIDKVQVLYMHAKVNGVEVFAAVKAPRQIGLWLNRGMPACAKGAAEPEDALERFRGNGEQCFDHMADWDMISHFIQLSVAELPAHREVSLGRRLTQFFILTMWLISVNRSINAAVR